jgi:uncharacterized membrane protein HdeD (DUF308 family)
MNLPGMSHRQRGSSLWDDVRARCPVHDQVAGFAAARHAHERSDMELGAKFWLALIGGCIAIAVGSVLAFAIFTAAWARWGLIGALILVSAVVLGLAYLEDRRERKRYDELPT